MNCCGKEWHKIKYKDQKFDGTKSPAGNLKDFYNKPTEYLQIRKLVNRNLILEQRRALQNLLVKKEEIKVSLNEDDGLSNLYHFVSAFKEFKNKKKRRLIVGVIRNMNRISKEIYQLTNETDVITNILEKRMISERDTELYFHLATLSGRSHFFSTERTPASDILKSRDCNENKIQNEPSDVVKSNNCDIIGKRRFYLRKDVSGLRQNNRLKAFNLNRGLVLDEESRETSKSNSAFDLTSIDKALPPVPHCSKDALANQPRILKLQLLLNEKRSLYRRLRLTANKFMSLEAAIKKKTNKTGD